MTKIVILALKFLKIYGLMAGYMAISTIGHLQASYIISTFAGNGTEGYSGDSGPATAAELDACFSVCADSSKNIYIADFLNNIIRFVPAADTIRNSVAYTAGNIYTIAGTAGNQGLSGDGGLATAALLTYPTDLKVDSSGNLFYSDRRRVIRRIDTSTGIITKIAGTASDVGYSGDGGLATSAKLNQVHAIDIDSSGSVYIADSLNHVIRFVPAVNINLNSVSYTAGNIYTIAGNGTPGYQGDGGLATSAEVYRPYGIAVDSSASNIYRTLCKILYLRGIFFHLNDKQKFF